MEIFNPFGLNLGSAPFFGGFQPVSPLAVNPLTAQILSQSFSQSFAQSFSSSFSQSFNGTNFSQSFASSFAQSFASSFSQTVIAPLAPIAVPGLLY